MMCLQSTPFDVPFDIMVAIARRYHVSLDCLAELTDTPRTFDGKPYAVKPSSDR